MVFHFGSETVTANSSATRMRFVWQWIMLARVAARWKCLRPKPSKVESTHSYTSGTFGGTRGPQGKPMCATEFLSASIFLQSP